MPTLVGTNYSYKAKDFLDERQGIAKSKEELKNWTTPVPESFEVCLDGVWYYYDKNIDLKDTGHWVPRTADTLDSSVSDKQSASTGSLKEVKDQIDNVVDTVRDLDSSMYPCAITKVMAGSAFNSTSTFNIYRAYILEKLSSLISMNKYEKELDRNGDGIIDNSDTVLWNSFLNQVESTIPYNTTAGTSSTYWLELGSYVLPKITWNVVKPMITWELSGNSVVWKVVDGSQNNTIPVKESVVKGETIGYLDTNKTTWISNECIGSSVRKTYSYSITSTSESGLTSSTSAYFKFAYKSYCGTGSLSLWNKSSLSYSDISSFTNRFTESGALSETHFNCSGGKYPYILIPRDLYNSSLKTYVSKNLNSDFLIKDVIITNSRGVQLNYKLYRTNYIQTGSNIGIEIK